MILCLHVSLSVRVRVFVCKCVSFSFSSSSFSIKTKIYNTNSKSEKKCIPSDFNEKVVFAKDILSAATSNLLFSSSFLWMREKKETATKKSTHFSGNLYHVTSIKVLLSKNITTWKKCADTQNTNVIHFHTHIHTHISHRDIQTWSLMCCIEGICCDHPEKMEKKTRESEMCKSEISDNCSSLRPNQLFIPNEKQQTDMLGTKYNGYKQKSLIISNRTKNAAQQQQQHRN